MGRTSRLLDIIQLMRRASSPVTADVIAETLEVSKRTVYRDIVALQAMQVPINGEAGIGYVIEPGFELPPLMFTLEEVEAIKVGLSLIGRTRDQELLASARSAALKIANVLPEPVRGHMKNSTLQVSHWNAIPDASVDSGFLRTAIRNERKVHLTYKDAELRSTERVICPLAMVYYVDSVVVLAWCELRGAIRHFRMDRIVGCKLLDATFASESRRFRTAWSDEQTFAGSLTGLT